VAGKPQTATFGPYPVVSLADARKRRDELLARLAAGENPKTLKASGGGGMAYGTATLRMYAANIYGLPSPTR
jgi:hypothetical protein